MTSLPYGEPNSAASIGINCAGVCWLHRWRRHVCRIPIAALPARCCLLSIHWLLFPRDPEVLQSWRAPGSHVAAAPHPSPHSCGEQGARGGGAGDLAQGGGEAAGLVLLVKRRSSSGSGCFQHCAKLRLPQPGAPWGRNLPSPDGAVGWKSGGQSCWGW